MCIFPTMTNQYSSFLFVYLNTISKIRKKQEKQMKKCPLYTWKTIQTPSLHYLFLGSSQNIKKENKIKKTRAIYLCDAVSMCGVTGVLDI